MSSTVPDPWEGLPTGTLSQFIEPALRDHLILDKAVVEVLGIDPAITVHGPRIYVRILIPPDGIERTCSFDKKDKNHPRLKGLTALQEWMLRYPEEKLYAILIGAGNGYMLAAPPRA